MLKRYGLLFLMSALIIQCQLPTPSDVLPPALLVVYPFSGAVVSSNIKVRLEATDNEGIKEAWIYLDGQYVSKTSTSPYLIDLDITNYQDNLTHIIQAAASDDAGNIGYSAPVIFTIADSPDIIFPKVSILNPTAGQSVEKTVHIVALAEDERSIQQVDFYVDGEKKGQSTSEPYSYDWNTDSYPDSTNHTIYAKATDGGNNTTTSAVVTVTVLRSADKIPPTVLTLYPIAGSTVTGTVNVSADVQDNVGVSRVEFYVDGVLQSGATDTSAPWGFAWDTTPQADGGTHSLYIKAYDTSGNVGTSGITVVTVN